MADLASSLVREYLNRKGLKKTLAQLDIELPRTEKSISKRNVLARTLNIESVIKQYKTTPTSQEQPLSMIECLVQYLLENPIDIRIDHTPHGKPITSTIEPHPINIGGQPLNTGPRSRMRHKDGVMSTGLQSINKSHGRVKIKGVPKGLIINDEQPPPVEANKSKEPLPHDLSHDMKSHDNSSRSDDSTLLCEDIEDGSIPTLTPNVLAGKTTQRNATSSPINIAVAKSLRELIFGTATGPSFNKEWRIQGVTMENSVPELSHGIVQHKGGPCGLLACIQAYILKHVLFNGTNSAKRLDSVPVLSDRQQRAVIIEAISEILWKVRTNNTVIVTLKGLTPIITSTNHSIYSPDGLTEQLRLYEFSQFDLLKEFIKKSLQNFIANDGAILILYSIVLSHGIAQIKQEGDSPTNVLIGCHGYCCQELINLILTGCATSNVFDGQSIIEEDNASPTILRGVTSTCDIGHLSLYEHYQTLKVGTHYKYPRLPIWVVYAESHYTVLFSCNIDNIKDTMSSSSRSFSLHYYDGLAHSPEPVILDVQFGGSKAPGVKVNDDLIPPLELVIKTRWPDCSSIIWNCEPIL